MCISCLVGLIPEKYLSGNACVSGSNCDSGTYPNQANNQCDLCVAPCLTCASAVTCITCINTYNF